ncbi:hypothetical protein D0X99_19790 [Algoriphagus lacus]|uniref:Uncharacterized protein n=1 Tax=Algoriphagus lacus TaxID=2056311 RepID=A0A418PLE0_9BACT|nr:hypothetical protein D0X99_19790 [Algoriphagus lacus]
MGFRFFFTSTFIPINYNSARVELDRISNEKSKSDFLQLDMLEKVDSREIELEKWPDQTGQESVVLPFESADS